ncbi:unnamed protein product [Phytophthora lilii]|uniref:Unnamed protein product n=1 Tax=Phytophthora lilii TaxID=2077276 RepID=A0A9W6XFP4_9STRA|nr:unnamed protein product [Phytophthora lilii]
MFLAVCCNLGLIIRQFDVETAFLNGDLEEDVYMAPPLGIDIPEGMVCKLRRSLYGLKQAAAVWFKKIRSVFISMGFVQCRADPCLFVRHQAGRDASPVFIILYVDDLLIGCKSDEIADKIRDELAEHFTLKSLGEARYVLGMEIHVLLLLGGGPVVYKSKRQATVALSSAEAEYMALALASQEVIWLRYLLAEMGYKIGNASTIYLDNKSAISIATNHGYTPRAKHIDLRAHFVRDHVEAGNIKLEHVPSSEQLADYLTKAIPTPQLVKLREASVVLRLSWERSCRLPPKFQTVTSCRDMG